MLRHIDRILLRVPNVESAVRYYRDVMGLRLIRQSKSLANLRFPDGHGEIVLHSDPDLPGEAIYYLVDDVRDLYNRREEFALSFLSPPVQATRGYRAAIKDPFGNVLQILDRSSDPEGHAIEDAKAPDALFAGVETRASVKADVLIRLYEQIARTADDLPYTPHFESLYKGYVAASPDPKPTRSEVWRHLLNLRKAGKLPKLGAARSKPPAIAAAAREKLRELVGEDIGRRDRLPYTDRFDAIVDDFNRSSPRPLSPHVVWRLVATLAK